MQPKGMDCPPAIEMSVIIRSVVGRQASFKANPDCPVYWELKDKVVRFKPVPAHQTPEMMERLHALFNDRWDRGEVDALLLIPTYVLDFLCIHPFLDGNSIN
jgi:Fic family protein